MKPLLIVLAAAVLAAALVAPGGGRQPDTDGIEGRIVEVVDGDTVHVRVAGERHTVRLLGIDTPESRRPGTPVECGALEAAAELRRLSFGPRAGAGRRVTLLTDPTQDREDRYGRLLAYVQPRGGPMLQTAMLHSGWATTYVFERRFAEYGRFRAAERRARRAGRGVWGRCGGDFHRP